MTRNKKLTFVVMSVGWYQIIKWAAPIASKLANEAATRLEGGSDDLAIIRNAADQFERFVSEIEENGSSKITLKDGRTIRGYVGYHADCDDRSTIKGEIEDEVDLPDTKNMENNVVENITNQLKSAPRSTP